MLLAALAVAAAGIPVTHAAAWRLTGISRDTRTLHLVYAGGGCLQPDGRATVDTIDPTAVRIAIEQTTLAGDYVVCTTELGFLPLDVDLGAPLAGRRVTGGPDFAARLPTDVMPRVVGLRRADAARALRRQSVHAEAAGRRSGVITFQSPRAGAPVPRRGAFLISGPFDPRARLTIRVPPQSAEAVRERGLRFRYRVDPAAERALYAYLRCNGQDGGNGGWPVHRARGTRSLHIASIQLRRELRRRPRSTCRLEVQSFARNSRSPTDWLIRRTATITLARRER